MSGKTPTSNGVVDAAESAAMNGSAGNGDEWDWKRIEAENARGMKWAEHFMALDGLYGEFTGEEKPALGIYRDPF